MANTTFTKTLSLMAYENNLTADVPDDYSRGLPPEHRKKETPERAQQEYNEPIL